MPVSPKTVKIKYFRNSKGEIHPLSFNKVGDWVDLYTKDDVHFLPGQYRNIPLGVAMRLPVGYEAIVVPRSSTFAKYGLIQVNSVGVIDETYCGNNDEWHFPAMCVDQGVTIPAGTRLCQFRIIRHQPAFDFEIVTSLGSVDRGGFGSTGD